MKKLLLCVSTAFLAMLAGCSEGIGGGDFSTNLSGNNKIYYTTTDGKNVVLSGNFDSILISNTYKNGKGCLTFDEEVTIIGESAFYDCENLLSIEIPDSVTEIGNNAFSNCTSLTSITIPDSVNSIGDSAFNGCTGELIINSRIVKTDYSHDYPPSSGWLKGAKFFKLTIGNGVTKIGNYAFYECTSLTSVTIPDSVTSIGHAAFANCTSLTSVTIPDSITEIGGYAFYECTSLTSVTIGNRVTSIGNMAFFNCTSLTSVTIGNRVTSIGNMAFFKCTSLTSVFCKPTTPPTAGNFGMFNFNASERKIYVPTESVDAYKNAPYWSDYRSRIYGYDF